MGLPPNHPVDHTPKLILSFDSAWDKDRLAREGLVDSHPWTRYIRSQTRGDLDSVVLGYLKPDLTPSQEPVVFSFRRMTRPQWSLYVDRAATRADGTTRASYARETAIRYCLEGVDGDPIKFGRGGTEDGALDDDDMDRLRKMVGDTGIDQIGRMAVECSRELLAPEKKP